MFNSTDNFFRNVCVADFHRFYMSNTNTYCILQPFITTLQNLLDNTQCHSRFAWQIEHGFASLQFFIQLQGFLFVFVMQQFYGIKSGKLAWRVFAIARCIFCRLFCPQLLHNFLSVLCQQFCDDMLADCFQCEKQRQLWLYILKMFVCNTCLVPMSFVLKQ